MQFLAPPWCSACALPFPFAQAEAARCATCLATPPLHDGIRAVVAYDDVSRQVVLKLKYGGKIGLAKMIAAQLLRHLPAEQEDIIITAVPLHWTRLWSRSFNQSVLIGRELARLGGLKFVPDLVLRTKRTPTMRGLSASERHRAVGRAFEVNPRYHDQLRSANIILVDDVLTTGATADGCIRTLKKAGAEWVQVFCWARVVRGEALVDSQPIAIDA